MKLTRFYTLIFACLAVVATACTAQGEKCDKQCDTCTKHTVMMADYSHVAPAPAPMQDGKYVCQRPAEADRLFTSKAIEAEIAKVQQMLTNPRLAWMFSNCFPNTLDTTVHYRNDKNGKDYTFVYTGDIHAMWLRDSGAQVWPFVQFANEDAELKAMLAGVINRQFISINIDPYANAFNDGPTGCEWISDLPI